MEEILVNRGDSVYKLYIIGGWDDGCSEDLSAEDIINGRPQSIVVERDSRADVVVLVFPGISADLKLDVRLVGEGAEANVYGAYVCGGEEKVKIAVDMYHDVPHCNSRQLFKGIAGGTSRVDFYGKIIVAQDAQRTEAYQENHNILLSDGAKVDTKPQLEIYADDVKCSHGATIGRLNEEEQFYMRSRGISLEDAKVLQMISFIAPVLEHVEDEAQREALTTRIESEIRNMIQERNRYDNQSECQDKSGLECPAETGRRLS